MQEATCRRKKSCVDFRQLFRNRLENHRKCIESVAAKNQPHPAIPTVAWCESHLYFHLINSLLFWRACTLWMLRFFFSCVDVSISFTFEFIVNSYSRKVKRKNALWVRSIDQLVHSSILKLYIKGSNGVRWMNMK